ncbi:MAG TPA: hypothetical protein VHF27_10375 [Acidimicrobiales bacterium]|nr:hypothetical protein [Acidimicrobiales bacterium]
MAVAPGRVMVRRPFPEGDPVPLEEAVVAAQGDYAELFELQARAYR